MVVVYHQQEDTPTGFCKECGRLESQCDCTDCSACSKKCNKETLMFATPKGFVCEECNTRINHNHAPY